MNKTELIAAISDLNDIPKSTVGPVLNACLETIAEALEEGEKVDLAGFGSFSITPVAARKGRNPATGETIDIPASNRVKFKPSAKLKRAVK